MFNHDRESEAATQESFRMTMVHQIDKDVVRTDRSHPYYQGDENTHVGTLKYGGSQYTCRVMYHWHGL